MSKSGHMQGVQEKAVEESLSRFLQYTGLPSLAGGLFIVAVSGGADSVFLLMILHSLRSRFGYLLEAVTVDHRLRPESESGGDLRFVVELCSSLSPPVPCRTEILAEGAVSSCAALRGKGIEDAARHLRYEAFQRCLESRPQSWVLTAHTASDQLETVLMRFLQGGSRAGIQTIRGRFFRPLLHLERSDIESWLRRENIRWREDSTNADISYRRNHIRSRLMPFLDSEFPGWRTGVQTGLLHAELDESFFSATEYPEWKIEVSGLTCSPDRFYALHPARRLRFLKAGLALLQTSHRVPAKLLMSIAASPRPEAHSSVRISGSSLRFISDRSGVFFGSDIVHNTKRGYPVLVSGPCECELPHGLVAIVPEGSGARIGSLDCVFPLPLTIRSRKPGDVVVRADGKRKVLKKIYTDWAVPIHLRDSIPVIEAGGAVRAVWGSPYGFPDLITTH